MCLEEGKLSVVKKVIKKEKSVFYFNQNVKKVTTFIKIDSSDAFFLNSTTSSNTSLPSTEERIRVSKINCDRNQNFVLKIVSDQSKFLQFSAANISYLSFCSLNLTIPSKELTGGQRDTITYSLLFQKEETVVQRNSTGIEIPTKIAMIFTFVSSLFSAKFLAFLVTMCDSVFMMQIIKNLKFEVENSFFDIISQLDFNIGLKFQVSENVESNRAFKSRASREFVDSGSLELPSDFFDFTLVLLYLCNGIIFLMDTFKESLPFSQSFSYDLYTFAFNFIEAFVLTNGIPCFYDYLMQVYEGLFAGMSTRDYFLAIFFVWNLMLSFLNMFEIANDIIFASEKQLEELRNSHKSAFVFFIPDFMPSRFDAIYSALKNYAIVLVSLVLRDFPFAAISIIIYIQWLFVAWRFGLIRKLRSIERVLLFIIEILLLLFDVCYALFVITNLNFFIIVFLDIFIGVTVSSILIGIIGGIESVFELYIDSQSVKEKSKVENTKVVRKKVSSCKTLGEAKPANPESQANSPDAENQLVIQLEEKANFQNEIEEEEKISWAPGERDEFPQDRRSPVAKSRFSRNINGRSMLRQMDDL